MWRKIVPLSAGTAVGQALVIAVSPVLTRLYGPESFGQLALFLAFVSVAMVFVGLRYDLAIMSAPESREADDLLVAAILICVPTSAIAAIVLWAMMAGEVLGFDRLPGAAAPAAALFLLAAGVMTSLRNWNVRHQRVKEVGIASALQGAGRAAAPLAIAAANPGWWGLLAGELVGRIAGVTRLARGPLGVLDRASRGGTWSVIRKYRSYPLVLLPSSAIDATAQMLPLALIVAFFGTADAGQFTLVQRIAAVPAALLVSSFADVIHAEGVLRAGSARGNLRELALQTGKKLSWVGSIIYVPLLFLSPYLFYRVFGIEWTVAGSVATILAPLLWLTLVVSPLSRLILVSGRTGLKFVADMICLVLPAAALLAFKDQSFLAALVSFSIAGCVAQIMYLAVIWRAIRPAPGESGE